MNIYFWVSFLSVFALLKGGECVKKVFSPRGPSKTSAPVGIVVQATANGCTPAHIEAGFKTFLNEEGEAACVCPSGKGFSKVKGNPHCFTCQGENQVVIASKCTCVKPQDPALIASLTTNGSCTFSRIGPSALAHVRGDRRGSQKPSAPSPSYGPKIHHRSYPASHESCQRVENKHLCRVGPRLESFACFNLEKSVKHCGNCTHDCSSIPYSQEVSCDNGKCKIASCKPGFKLQVNQSNSDMSEVNIPKCLPI
ncbi:hypothetical protein CROQUDRAFT_671959 [Cronartium quercuum f. sp. fusiforme G11]|uniref:Protein CPL1-like domain-containing protein n=1 Tax=Cronartium quercuum f. sp. fusiforme G11 TaxID=708437 RepID=A0A9P6NGG6_9BASI|nr:hypothetical protein CROQUDRAFT_671959 [Cronartium quercuum f. sp. fusiforme G11]